MSSAQFLNPNCPSSSRVNYSSYYVNSKDICFLCLQVGQFFIHHENFGFNLPHGNIWNLQNLLSFLNINLSGAIQGSLPNLNKGAAEWSDVRVHLCSECHALALRFTELYETLELTQLRLNECIRRINNVLLTSNNDPSRVEGTRRLLMGMGGGGARMMIPVNQNNGGDDGVMTFGVMTKLRSEILRMGSLKIPPEPSLVVLNPPPVVTSSSVGVPPPPVNDAYGTSEYAADDFVGMPDEDQGQSDSEPEAKPEPKPKTKGTKNKSDSIKPFKFRGQKSSDPVCEICSHKIDPRHAEDHVLKLHMHQHNFFKDLRLPHITEELFKKVLYHVLFEDLKFHEINNGKEKKIKCQFCDKEYFKTKLQGPHDLRKHLIRHHSEIVQRRLTEIQNEPIDEIQWKVKEGQGQEKGFVGVTCRCGCYLVNSVALVLHVRQYNCETEEELRKRSDSQSTSGVTHSISSRDATKPSEDDEPTCPTDAEDQSVEPEGGATALVTCRFCLNATTKRVVIHHEFNYHCHEFLKQYRLPHVPEDVFTKIVHHRLFDDYDGKLENGKGGAKNCPHCPEGSRGITLKSKGNGSHDMRRHLILKHPRIISDKLKELQENLDEVRKGLEEKLKNYEGGTCVCGCYLATRKAFRAHIQMFNCAIDENLKARLKAKKKKVRNYKPTKCTFCPATISQGRNVKVHEISYHLHELLKDYRLPDTNDEIFKTILYCILFKNVKKKMDGPKSTVKCPYCPKELSLISTLATNKMRQHLLEDHHKVVMGRLKKLQREPEDEIRKQLEEKRRKPDFVGMTCPCGTYLYSVPTLTIHKAYCDEGKKLSLGSRLSLNMAPPSGQGEGGRLSEGAEPLRKADGDGSFVHCRFCPDLVKARPSSIESHEVTYHTHEFLKPHQLPHVSQDVFNKICGLLLFQNIEEIGDDDLDGKKLLKCPWCSVTGVKSGYSVQRHMLKMHLEAVVEQLVKLQNDLEGSERALEKIRRESQFNAKTCVCGCFLGTVASSTRHLRYVQCNSSSGARPVRTIKKIVRNKNTNKCPHCRATYKEVGFERFKTHMVHHHLDKFLSQNGGGDELKNEKLTPLQFSNVLYHLLFEDVEASTKHLKEDETALLPCPHCDNQFDYRKHGGVFYSDIRLHLIEHHRQELNERLVKIKEDPQVLQKLELIRGGKLCSACGEYFCTPQFYNTHQRHYCKNREPVVRTKHDKTDLWKRRVQCDWCQMWIVPGGMGIHKRKQCENRELFKGQVERKRNLRERLKNFIEEAEDSCSGSEDTSGDEQYYQVPSPKRIKVEVESD